MEPYICLKGRPEWVLIFAEKDVEKTGYKL